MRSLGCRAGLLCAGRPQGPPVPPFVVDDEELRAAFNFFDARGSGKITAADLKVRSALEMAGFYVSVAALHTAAFDHVLCLRRND
jgi:hypothetical protein